MYPYDKQLMINTLRRLALIAVAAVIFALWDESRGDTLQQVNDKWNAVPAATDQQTWGVDDYWATPDEIRRVNAADCEDYATAKRADLITAGYPAESLLLAYVVSQYGPHMVLAYYPTPDADPLILDNLIDEIRPASQRSDLRFVFAFGDDGIRGYPNHGGLSLWADYTRRLNHSTRFPGSTSD